MRLDRVLFASDLHANYIQFWPLVSRVWQHVTGAKPTLFFVAPPGTAIEHVPGCEIIFVSPPTDLPTCFVAQTIRLLAPLWFPNEVCVISDIDMMVVQPGFLSSYIRQHAATKLVCLNRYPAKIGRCSMCYHIGTGATFARLWDEPASGAPTWPHVFDRLRQFHQAQTGQWATDELVLHEAVTRFKAKEPHTVVQVFVPNLWENSTRCLTHYKGFKFNPREAARYVEIEPPYPYVTHRAAIHAALRAILPTFSTASIAVTQLGVERTNRHPIKSTGQRVAPVVPRRLIPQRLPRGVQRRALRTVVRTGLARAPTGLARAPVIRVRPLVRRGKPLRRPQ